MLCDCFFEEVLPESTCIESYITHTKRAVPQNIDEKVFLNAMWNRHVQRIEIQKRPSEILQQVSELCGVH